jgi:hypothetical protein
MQIFNRVPEDRFLGSTRQTIAPIYGRIGDRPTTALDHRWRPAVTRDARKRPDACRSVL